MLQLQVGPHDAQEKVFHAWRNLISMAPFSYSKKNTLDYCRQDIAAQKLKMGLAPKTSNSKAGCKIKCHKVSLPTSLQIGWMFLVALNCLLKGEWCSLLVGNPKLWWYTNLVASSHLSFEWLSIRTTCSAMNMEILLSVIEAGISECYHYRLCKVIASNQGVSLLLLQEGSSWFAQSIESITIAVSQTTSLALCAKRWEEIWSMNSPQGCYAMLQ